MKLIKVLQSGVLCGSALLMFLSTNVEQAEAQVTSGCYVIRSLNRNFQTDMRYLGVVQRSSRNPGSSDGSASVQEFSSTTNVPGLTSRTSIWLVTPTDRGSLLTEERQKRNLDGASNGLTTKLLSPDNITHGQYWEIYQDGNGYRIRSLNNNFRNQNHRWLDGASDGLTVKLVNGTSHGTLWEFTSTNCQ